MKLKAVFVGINKYPRYNGQDISLRGCVNDVADIKNILRTYFGLKSSYTRILTDSKATHANILASMAWLQRKSKPDDVLVFYDSSHGSQLPDRNGDEADRYDECICPVDFASAGMLIDDEIAEAMSNPGGSRIEMLFDSCHAGTVNKNVYTMVPRCIPNTLVPRTARASHTKVAYGTILWAACKDYQTSNELVINGQVRGLFTWAFCKAIRDKNANRKSVLAATIKGMSGYVSSIAQTPELVCSSTELIDSPFK